MKIVLIFLMLLLSCIRIYPLNRALLIGIGNYPKESGWVPISSENDISLLNNTLKNQFNVSFHLL